jgi:hypothetical protein
MSRLVQHEQLAMLTNLRAALSISISAKNGEEMYRDIGKVQGFLLGLQVAGEIDAETMKSLEDEVMYEVIFQLNLVKA